MKNLILCAVWAICVHSALADEEPFFVATSDGIYHGAIDSQTGTIKPLQVACAVKGANFLALSPDGRSLYATVNDSVEAFAVGPGGHLTPLDEKPSGGSGPCHVSVDGSGRDVLVADYGGACIACLRRNTDGSLGAQTALEHFTGSGPDPVRQTQSYGHSIYADPGDKFVYACDLGSDHVWIFKFDAAEGTLAAADPASAGLPPGSGPRHLVFGAQGRFVYVANEMGHSVTAFARDSASGALTAMKTVSTLSPEISSVGVTTAEIAVHPSGKWLYVSNRGCETISELSLAADGTPQLVQSVPSPAKFPRQFMLDPTGQWMIVAGQKDTRLAVLKIDAATGKLSATHKTAAANAAMCVLLY